MIINKPLCMPPGDFSFNRADTIITGYALWLREWGIGFGPRRGEKNYFSCSVTELLCELGQISSLQ